MKKTMLIVLALLGLMAQGMSAQPRSRIVEEGGTGAYKAVMKEVATLPAHSRRSVRNTRFPYWYGATVPVATLHGSTTNFSMR